MQRSTVGCRDKPHSPHHTHMSKRPTREAPAAPRKKHRILDKYPDYWLEKIGEPYEDGPHPPGVVGWGGTLHPNRHKNIQATLRRWRQKRDPTHATTYTFEVQQECIWKRQACMYVHTPAGASMPPEILQRILDFAPAAIKFKPRFCAWCDRSDHTEVQGQKSRCAFARGKRPPAPISAWQKRHG